METGSRKSDTHLNESSRLQQLKHYKVDGFNDGYISKFSEKSFIFNGVGGGAEGIRTLETVPRLHP